MCRRHASAEDVLEFMIAGVSAVQLGSANLAHPDAMLRAIDGVEEWLRAEKIPDVNELIGSPETGPMEDDLTAFNE